MPRRLPRPHAGLWVLSLVGALVAVVLTAPVASAHARLVSTSPGDGTTVPTAPATVVLTFNEQVVALGARVIVTGPEGAVQDGAPRVDGAVLTQDLRLGAPAGPHTVEWRITANDGHPMSGTFTFAAEAPTPLDTPAPAAPPTPEPSPDAPDAALMNGALPSPPPDATPSEGSLFGMPVLTGAGVLVLAGLAWAFARRFGGRRRPRG